MTTIALRSSRAAGLPPFQLRRRIGDVPETRQSNCRFRSIEPQLVDRPNHLHPAAISRRHSPRNIAALFKIERKRTADVLLPLAGSLEEFADELLAHARRPGGIGSRSKFDTPFSAKGRGGRRRMNVSTGPIAKPADCDAACGAGVSGRENANRSSRPRLKTSTLRKMPIPIDRPARTALQVALDTDEKLDAKAVVAHASTLAGRERLRHRFLRRAQPGGEYSARIRGRRALRAWRRRSMQADRRIRWWRPTSDRSTGMTLYCAKTPVSFFAHGNICLAALHSARCARGRDPRPPQLSLRGSLARNVCPASLTTNKKPCPSSTTPVARFSSRSSITVLRFAARRPISPTSTSGSARPIAAISSRSRPPPTALCSSISCP